MQEPVLKSARHKRWADKNKEHLRAYKRRRYAENPGLHAAVARAFRAANPEVFARRSRAQRERSPAIFMLKAARKRAKRLGLIFDLLRIDIIVPELCPVLGIPLRIARGKADDNSPTLDRINNNRGYVRGNICVISHRANRLKSDSTIEELKAILLYAQEQEKV
jgi:hypothetical protein